MFFSIHIIRQHLIFILTIRYCLTIICLLRWRIQIVNEIRKNTDVEKILAKATCKMPTLYIVLYSFAIFVFLLQVIIGLCLAIICISQENNNYNADMSTDIAISIISLIVGLICLIFSILFFVLQFKAIQKSKCFVTNKRIYGTMAYFITQRDYSYRLDTIDNADVIRTLGLNQLVLTFSQGNNAPQQVMYQTDRGRIAASNIFAIKYIVDSSKVYEAVSNIIASIKSDKDLHTDIEMKKIDAQIKQAEAFERIAVNIGGTSTPTNSQSAPASKDYITELKGLKELLDNGIITKQEFDEKKEHLLKQ